MRRTVLLVFFIFNSLSAKEPVELYGAGPGVFFENVNLLSGDYVESFPIMQFNGGIPFTLNATVTRYDGLLVNLDEIVTVPSTRGYVKECHIHAPGFISCNAQMSNYGHWGDFHIRMSENRGLTNLIEGAPSGKTYPGNLKGTCVENQHVILKTGDGTVKTYVSYRREYENADDGCYGFEKFRLAKEVLPTGQEISIQGKYRRNISTDYWSIYQSPPKLKDNALTRFRSSDGRVHTHTTYWDSDGWGEHKYYPLIVKPANLPQVTYRYSKNRHNLLVEIIKPDNQHTKIEYHGLRDGLRVKGIYARKDTLKNYLRKYEFRYGIADHQNYTLVLSSNRKVLEVQSNNRKIIHQKTWFCDGKPKTIQRFHWGELGKQDGMLVWDEILDSGFNSFKKNEYFYDDFGNVIEERLTGYISSPSFLDTRPSYVSYSTDGFNLPYTRVDRGITTCFEYKEGTSLLTAKLSKTDAGIFQREFFKYSNNSLLIEEISDDGSQASQESLDSVTSRMIKRYKYSKEGFVREVQEFYYDLEKCEEKLLKRVEREFTREGWVTREDTFDGNNELAFSCSWTYNSFGQVLCFIDSRGFQRINRYSASGKLIHSSLPSLGYTYKYKYDFVGYLTAEITEDSEGNSFTEHYKRDIRGNCLEKRDWLGNVTKYSYDEQGRLVKEVLPSIETPSGEAFSPHSYREYDYLGRVCKEVNTRGAATIKSHNIDNELFSVVYPDGSCEEFRYDLYGRLVLHVLQNKTHLKYEYDRQNRIVKELTISSAGELVSTVQKKYFRSQLIEEIDQEGVSTFYKYDFAGRLIEELKGENRKQYFHDSLGRVSTERTWLNDESESYFDKCFVYDTEDRLIKQTFMNSDGEIQTLEKYVYDQLGRVVEKTNGSETTINQYDVLGRLTREISPSGLVTEVNYSSIKNRLGQNLLHKNTLTPSGLTVCETHDSLGNCVLEEKFSSEGKLLSSIHKFYDSESNLIFQKSEAIKEETALHTSFVSWEYNLLDQEVISVAQEGSELSRATRTTYTPFGEKELVTKPDGTALHHEYNCLGLLSRLHVEAQLDYTYLYDKKNRLVSVTDHINNTCSKREWDVHDNLVYEQLSNGLTITATYDGANRVSSLFYPDGSFVKYQWCGKNLEDVTYFFEGKSFTTKFISYDLSGRILEKQYPLEVGSERVEYDPEGRIISLNTPFFNELEIIYDDAGNILSKTYEYEGTQTRYSYEYDELNQLIRENGGIDHEYSFDSLYNRRSYDQMEYSLNALNEVDKVGSTKYLNSRNGSIVRKGDVSFHYDCLERLTQVKSSTMDICYEYDPFGRVVSRAKDQDTRLYFHFDDYELGSYVNDEVRDCRVLGPGRGGELGAAVIFAHNKTLSIPVHDAYGNVRVTSNLGGSLLSRYTYSAFGVLESDNGGSNEWLYASKRCDPDTNLYNFGKRWYMPELGRFVSHDPLGYSQGPNLYAYVHNCPLTHRDLFGLLDEDERTFIDKSKSVACGSFHACVDFTVDSYHGMEMMCAQVGADFEDDFMERYSALSSVSECQENRCNSIDSSIRDLFSIEEGDVYYDNSRKYTRYGIEAAALVSTGYGIVRGGSSLIRSSSRAQSRLLNRAGKSNFKIHWGKQNKHIPGSHNYEVNKSIISMPKDQLESLFHTKRGTGIGMRGEPFNPGYVEKVNFGEHIGYHVDVHTAKKTPTSLGIIHYDKTGGCHIVPTWQK